MSGSVRGKDHRGPVGRPLRHARNSAAFSQQADGFSAAGGDNPDFVGLAHLTIPDKHDPAAVKGEFCSPIVCAGRAFDNTPHRIVVERKEINSGRTGKRDQLAIGGPVHLTTTRNDTTGIEFAFCGSPARGISHRVSTEARVCFALLLAAVDANKVNIVFVVSPPREGNPLPIRRPHREAVVFLTSELLQLIALYSTDVNSCALRSPMIKGHRVAVGRESRTPGVGHPDEGVNMLYRRTRGKRGFAPNAPDHKATGDD